MKKGQNSKSIMLIILMISWLLTRRTTGVKHLGKLVLILENATGIGV